MISFLLNIIVVFIKWEKAKSGVLLSKWRELKLRYKKNITLLDRVSIGVGCSFSGGSISIGSNVTFVRNNEFVGNISIGSNVIFAANTFITARDHDISAEGNSLPYGTDYINKSITIEDNVWFGQYVVVLPGVKIGEGAVIGAGSVVVRDVDSCSISAGNPAKHIKYRDKERYKLLKSQNCFLNDIRGENYFSYFARIKLKANIIKKLKNKNKIYDYEILGKETYKVRSLMYSLQNENTIFVFDEGGFCLRKIK